MRTNSKMKYDKDGKKAMSGRINKNILKKAIEKIIKKKFDRSLDVKDFDISFVEGLSLEDGAATLTDYTSKILTSNPLFYTLDGKNVLISGGGRKNKFLIKRIEANSNHKI